MMIGELLARPKAREAKAGSPALTIEGLDLQGRGHSRLKDFDLTVRAGEIVGIAGVAGNGQDEIADAVTGLVKADAGRIRIGDHDVTGASLARRRAEGLRYLSPDRAAEGLCVVASIADNIIVGHHRLPEFCRAA